MSKEYIKEMVRKTLLAESKKTAYDYGCVMVYLKVDSKDWDSIQDVIEDEDLFVGTGDDKDMVARETEPHVTILYGIHGDVPDSDVEPIIDEIKRPEIKLKNVSAFKNEKYDVLKFDIESPYLHTLNDKFKKLPYTSNFPDYHPHCTIAYLKPNTSEKYIKLLNDKKGITVEPEKIVYSKPNGTKKDYKLK